jgi:hypothetical protein
MRNVDLEQDVEIEKEKQSENSKIGYRKNAIQR